MDERIEAVVVHQYPFPAERVFDCWLQTDAIRSWMSAALQAMGLPGEVGTVEVDPKVGGKFQFTDRRPQGEAFHWGTYKIVDRPTCLAFTWNASNRFEETDNELSLVTITLTPNEKGCYVRLVHSMDHQWKEYLERINNGWNNMLIHIQQFLMVH